MTVWTKKQIRTKEEAFKEFLAARGAQVMVPTNEWELIRFVSGEGTSIIYTNKEGGTTFIGEAMKAWTAFKTNNTWRATPATKRIRRSSVTLQTIRKRDGDLCFYCQQPVSVADESEEHLVALTDGGPQHISNKFLAHRICNSDVGHLSAVEKIRIRDAAIAKQETV